MQLIELLSQFLMSADKTALIYNDTTYSYEWLYKKIIELQAQLSDELEAGSVVQLIADFSPNAVATLIALALNNMIISPLTYPAEAKRREYEKVVGCKAIIKLNNEDHLTIVKTGTDAKHPLIEQLQERQQAGLIILSSGSSGKSKAIVHDLSTLLSKFSKSNKVYRTIAFLLFDHIGGLNTLFQTFVNQGTIVIPSARTPEDICQVIDRHQAEALVTSPSFLNLLLLSELQSQYDLSSLKIINYGSEPMPEFLLKKLMTLLPQTRLSQAFGMSELGVLKIRSKSSDSLFIKIDDDSADIRVVDGLLEVRSKTSMLGYMNAPSPFTEDGWLRTGDKVEIEGDYLRILGRDSDIINVGGEKVYPAEVENVLLKIDGIEDAIVSAEKNIILGQIVKASIKISDTANFDVIREKIKSHCRNQLAAYKIPQRIEKLTDFSHNERFKKTRKAA